jgi:hypothetical protein
MRFSVMLALSVCWTCVGCAQLDEPSEQVPEEAQRSSVAPLPSALGATVVEHLGSAASSFLWWPPPPPPPPPPSSVEEPADEMIVEAAADGARQVPR